MTKWTPDLSSRKGPKYRAILEALAADIVAGRLPKGERLPPQRDLAWRLGISLGAVTRAYAEATKRGLIGGEVGRGTFVLGDGEPPLMAHVARHRSPDGAAINFAVNDPAVSTELKDALRTTLRRIADDESVDALLHYGPVAGYVEHRSAAAIWLARRHRIELDPERLLLVDGAQHGLLVAFLACAESGDLVLTESATYVGVRSLAAALGMRLEGLAMDEEGVRPDAFDAACRHGGARVLYVTPTLQNPTTAIMSAQRRRELAAIARRHGATIVEDDVFGFLIQNAPPPIAATDPDAAIYVSSVSKSLTTGLRLGFVAVPPALFPRAEAALRASCRNVAPLMGEIARRWILDGLADRSADWQIAEARARTAILKEALAGFDLRAPDVTHHGWLRLPQGLGAGAFVSDARAGGVDLAPGESFALGRSAPQAVRISISAPPSQDDVRRGADALAELLRRPAAPDLSLV